MGLIKILDLKNKNSNCKGQRTVEIGTSDFCSQKEKEREKFGEMCVGFDFCSQKKKEREKFGEMCLGFSCVNATEFC